MQDFTYRSITTDLYFDKVFYINLKKDILRNESIVAQFTRFGIKNYERFEALEINHLPALDKYRNFNKKDERYVLGQLSCRASHVELVRTAKLRGYSRILIFEDDILILQNPNELLTRNNEILNDWDMLYFGGLIEPFFRNQIVCTHAYAIRNTVFDDILFMAEASGMEIDNFYAKILQHMSYNYNQSGKYNIRIIQPFNQIVQSPDFPSNIRVD